MAEKFYSQNAEESKLLTYSTVTQLQPTSSSTVSKNLGCVPRVYFQPQHNDTNRPPSQFYENLPQNVNIKNTSALKYSNQNIQSYMQSIQPTISNSNRSLNHSQQVGPYGNCFNRNRFMPYSYRSYATNFGVPYQQPQQQQFAPIYVNCSSAANNPILHKFNNNIEISDGSANGSSSIPMPAPSPHSNGDHCQAVTLQISNLDYTMDESTLRSFLLNQLKSITPVQSIIFESSSCAKVTVPDIHFAKQVVSNLHRKKIGHKRVVVSYTRDSSQTEFNTLRCQVAGLLKDVPYCTLKMYKFRELFQSRFKTSISVLDLYKMHDICNISTDKNDEKYISLHPDLMNSIENSALLECLQHSVPYCTIHFKREQHKGWAEQDIEPLPNVFMTISEIQQIAYPLLKRHTGDVPVASLVHCIEGELGIRINSNENGVNLEHLICCINGIQITTNNFGIKILGWLEPENTIGKDVNDNNRSRPKSGSLSDPLYQLSREVIELIKLYPKSTMKFNKFIPAYHNHFGKQCRVADYGYTKLIELFDALSSVVQVMGDGENRQITLTHRTQMRRFTTDLLRIIRTQGNKSILLSQLQNIFSLHQNRKFDVTEYGVCDVVDILDGLVNSNIVVLSHIQNDILISIPKRKQTATEIEKTLVFAGECVELLRNASQYSIQFQKFVRSYHYHFGYQCRLSDYGFLKLADLMESIQGAVEIEYTNDEDKRIYLSPTIARRVFAEQLEELIKELTGSGKTCMKLDEVFELHKKKYGYKIQPQTLGVDNILDAIKLLAYVEIIEEDQILWIICHLEDQVFRSKCYGACRVIQDSGKELLQINDFKNAFNMKYGETLTDHAIMTMKHAIEIKHENDVQYVGISKLMKFLIRIIGLIEKRYMNLADIKSILHINIGDCFEFGYPNLFTLLKAYSDMFVIEIGSSLERSEISLVPKIILATKNISNNYSRYRSNSGTFKTGKRSATIMLQDHNTLNSNNQPRQPLSAFNRPSKIVHYDEQKCDLNTSQEFIKYNNYHRNVQDMHNLHQSNDELVTLTEIREQQKPQYQQQNVTFFNTNNNKENFYNDVSHGSLNTSSGSDPNSSYGSINNGFNGESSKLWLRRNNKDYYSENNTNRISDILNFAIPCNYYKPSKPDTSLSENTPFWIDPIWANGNNEESQKVDSLKIDLPELKPYNILPMLMSPYTLSKLENMKQMFSFDKFDKNI